MLYDVRCMRMMYEVAKLKKETLRRWEVYIYVQSGDLDGERG